MPELSEEMYCSQQICIPPAFPYLLRQYAKAAIRTQPSDLLKWSTAYFRCLALNLAPPVKPRLEYPIPLDYHGLTPGWLKALVNQLPNAKTVSFKLLWDRWVGACLKHNTLIEILLLGRFTDNKAIPWWRFIALCAGHLTENLTHTMVMVCEILTEEPEGGSAMISVKAFMDIYRFLAEIDASKQQHLPNIYFTDSVLGLYEEEEKEKSITSEISTELAVTVDETAEEKEISVVIIEDIESLAVVSCPDIAAEEAPLETLEKTAFSPKGTEVLPESIDKTFALDKEVDLTSDKGGDKGENEDGEDKDKEGMPRGQEDKEREADDMDEIDETTDAKGNEADDKPQSPDLSSPGLTPPEKDEDGLNSNIGSAEDKEQSTDDENEDRSLGGDVKGDTAQKGEPPSDDAPKQKNIDEEGGSVNTLQEDTANRFKPKERQTPVAEQSDVDGDEVSAAEEISSDHHRTESPDTGDRNEPESAAAAKERGDGFENATSYEISLTGSGEEYDEEKQADDDSASLPRYEWFDVPAVPGIGPTVPLELVEIVDEYMTKVAKIQHGVVMPRNIRHFACPPLEVFDLQDE